MIRLVLPLFVLVASHAAASDFDALRVRRQETFEFTEKPSVVREGDRITIAFAAKAFCDATVAVEDAGGRIVRHLACGVLGPNAPAPFEKNSLRQTLVWDGKNDKGEYLDDKDALTVRVSLGLKARLERTLYWSPKKRSAADLGLGVSIQAAPEGVYVFDGGQAADHVRLFSHAGDYIRTVYPFPADKINDVRGLFWHTFPQDGQALPIKPTYQMCTFLTTGQNAMNICFKDGRYFYGAMDPAHKGEHGCATTDISVANGRIALGAFRLARLATDGSSGGLPVIGPSIDLRKPGGWYKATESALSVILGGYGPLTNIRPHRFALSPDARTLYLTCYIENFALDMYEHNYWQHGVYKMDYAGEKEPTLFLGAPEGGKDDAHFYMPADVACDAEGRVYVADCGNGRVQVFNPDGRLVKSIPVEAPAQLAVSPKTGELYVFSWALLPHCRDPKLTVKRPFVLRKFKSADDPRLLAAWELPMSRPRGMYGLCGDVDFWTDPPTIWVSPGNVVTSTRGDIVRTRPTGILLLAEKENKLELLRDFEEEARKAVLETDAPGNNRQRLYWDPERKLLYIGEGGFHFKDAIAADPATGRLRVVNLPFDAEDMTFDADGIAYMRTANMVMRFDPKTWREVPWDYGEERTHVTYNPNSGRREAAAISGLPLPVNSGWHHGGLHVSPSGHLAVGCLYLYGVKERGPAGQTPVEEGKAYTPKLFPGRITKAVYGCEYVHVWDKHGKVLFEDAIQGLGTLNGVAIDNFDNLYVLSAAPRVCDGKPWFNFLAGTLIKFKPGASRVTSDADTAPIPLSPENRPKRPPDLTGLPGSAWVEGAEWLFPGIGWHGKNHGLGCGCRNTRFALDYFGRSFAPEMDRYSVAVIDSSGNVIMRVGHYGNVDDGVPLAPGGGPPATRSIGGDEVSLMHGAYVATQTDRRLFVADIGNYRVVSVKLDYHASENVALKDVAERREK